MVTILVVEDDAKLNKLFCVVLDRSGYRTLSAADGAAALALLDREHVDLVITDIMMPEMDGFDLAASLRGADTGLPVLMITARDSFEDMEKGFNSGADDYMVKPVDVKELVLRVRALLRRAKIAGDRKIAVGDTVLDQDAMTVTVAGRELTLPHKEFQLLYKLAAYPNKIFTRQQLMDEIWGMETETDERTVDVHVNRLREKLRDCADIQIVTVRGLGYKTVREPEKH